MIRAGLLLAAFTAIHASAAVAACSEPEAPACASWFDQFDTPYDLQSCKQDMENYKDEADEYGKCLKDLADKMEKKAKKVGEDFERRASKGVASPQ
jgi:hypothetical protein